MRRAICLDGPLVPARPAGVAITKDEQDLMAVIVAWRGIATYPQAEEPRNRLLYAACCQLEARGLVSRVPSGNGVVLFVATRPNDE